MRSRFCKCFARKSSYRNCISLATTSLYTALARVPDLTCVRIKIQMKREGHRGRGGTGKITKRGRLPHIATTLYRPWLPVCLSLAHLGITVSDHQPPPPCPGGPLRASLRASPPRSLIGDTFPEYQPGTRWLSHWHFRGWVPRDSPRSHDTGVA